MLEALIDVIRFGSEVIKGIDLEKDKNNHVIDMITSEARYNLDILRLCQTKAAYQSTVVRQLLFSKLQCSTPDILRAANFPIQKLLGGKSELIEISQFKNVKSKTLPELYEFSMRKIRLLKQLSDMPVKFVDALKTSMRIRVLIDANIALIKELD